MRVERSGFALVYAMLVSISFVLFFAAWTVATRDTLRAVTLNESRLRAKALAGLGSDLAFQLLRARGLEWIQGDDFSFSNQAGASDYFAGISDPATRELFSETSLGGGFRVTFRTPQEGDFAGAVPDGGSYLLIESTGTVGSSSRSSSAASQMLVKLGVPFVNNLICLPSGGRFPGGTTLRGPIFINDEPPSNGDLVFSAFHIVPHANFPNQEVISPRAVMLGGEIRSRGAIQLASYRRNGSQLELYGTPEPLMAGSYPQGQTVTIPAPSVPGAILLPGFGGLQFTADSTVETYVELGLVPTPAESVLATVSQLGSAVDVTPYPEGVLLEVNGTTARLYRARREVRGRVYDAGLVATLWTKTLAPHVALTAHLEGLYGGAGALRAALAEAAWDEPAFPDDTLPSSLRQALLSQLQSMDPGATLSDIPLTGDYFEQVTIQPQGSALAEWTMSDEGWTSIGLTASSLSAVDEHGEPITPPVFLRGRVDGKLLLSYSLSGMEMSEDITQRRRLCQMVVLTDAGESGAPGGLRLADESVLTDPQGSSQTSDDFCLLVSRGTVNAAGPNLPYLGWVMQGEARQDLLGQTLGGMTPAEVERLESTPFLVAPLWGVATGTVIAHGTVSFSAGMRSSQYVDEPTGRFPSLLEEGPLLWEDLSGLAPAPRQGQDPALIPTHFRYAFRNRGIHWMATGGLSALDSTSSGDAAMGTLVYDYRWRRLDAETLRQNLGLPVQPIMIYRRLEN